MATVDIGRELFFILFLLVGIGSGILIYVGHKRRWGIFYDHQTSEWVFRRRSSISYKLLGDPEKGVYRNVVVGIAFFTIILLVIIIRLVSYISR